MKIIIIILVIILLLYIYLAIYNYYKTKHKYYEKEYHKDNRKLTNIEEQYVNICLKLAPIQHIYGIINKIIGKIIDNYCDRLSFITYSHRIENEKINNSSYVMGGYLFTNILEKYANRILKEKNINIKEDIKIKNREIIFYGLGFDFKEDYIKVYYRFNNWNKLEIDKNDKLNELNKDNKFNNKPGLIGITYKNNKLKDIKLYELKTDKETELISKNRKEKQINIKCENDIKLLLKKINKLGKDIIEKNRKENIYLDTYNYRNLNNYILYF